MKLNNLFENFSSQLHKQQNDSSDDESAVASRQTKNAQFNFVTAKDFVDKISEALLAMDDIESTTPSPGNFKFRKKGNSDLRSFVTLPTFKYYGPDISFYTFIRKGRQVGVGRYEIDTNDTIHYQNYDAEMPVEKCFITLINFYEIRYSKDFSLKEQTKYPLNIDTFDMVVSDIKRWFDKAPKY